MKKLLTMTMAFVVTTGWAQTKVNIQGVAAADAETIYFFDNLNMNRLIDSTTVKNGKWNYEAEQPIGSMLSIVADPQRMQSMQDMLKSLTAVMVDNTPTEVDLTTGSVKGSKASMAINEAIRGLYTCMINNSKEEAYKVMHKVVMENLDSEIPTHFVPMIAEALPVGDLQKIFDAHPEYAENSSMREAKERLRMLSGKSPRSIGKPFIDLTMNDTEGKAHKLSEYVGHGKYVLVDFWASWCGPCRAEMPNVLEAYNKYHDKGFEVIGISFDEKKDAWVKAVAQIQMPWLQLSDLKGFECAAAPIYKVDAIPDNILIDPQGKIIDRALRGKALHSRLQKIFGE